MAHSNKLAQPSRPRHPQPQLSAQQINNQPAIDLLSSWLTAKQIDTKSQPAQFLAISQALDEHRLSTRKLFP